MPLQLSFTDSEVAETPIRSGQVCLPAVVCIWFANESCKNRTVHVNTLCLKANAAYRLEMLLEGSEAMYISM